LLCDCEDRNRPGGGRMTGMVCGLRCLSSLTCGSARRFLGGVTRPKLRYAEARVALVFQ
jgi:hypothetical protein